VLIVVVVYNCVVGLFAVWGEHFILLVVFIEFFIEFLLSFYLIFRIIGEWLDG